MEFRKVLVQFFLIYFTPISLAPPTGEDTLVLLHVLFRHGNRTPNEGAQFPTDPYKDYTYEPFGLGQLTTKGKKTEYDIGEYLRLAYDHFIPEQYTPGVVYALTTNTERTKMSLQLVLASLFPPLLHDLFVINLNWQPVPFDVDEEEGVLQLPMFNCAKFINEYYQYVQSDEAQQLISNYTDLCQILTEYTGFEVKSPKEICHIYSVLESEYDYGFKLPDWTDDLFPEVLKEATGAYIELLSGNALLKKFSAGFLFKKILEDSLNAKNQSFKTKIFLYSGHDFNVGAVLKTLNVFERHMPPYGATIFFEIHDVNGVLGLKLYYQDYTDSTPKLLTIPGCSSFCELDRFYWLLKDYLPEDKDHCTTDPGQNKFK